MPQDAAHPNARFHEDPAFTKFSVSDPTIFETNVTEHVPIFFFHDITRTSGEWQQLREPTRRGCVSWQSGVRWPTTALIDCVPPNTSTGSGMRTQISS